MDFTRRDLLKKVGVAALGTGLGGMFLSMSDTTLMANDESKQIPKLPWPYKKLDPDKVAEAAYAGYYKGGCSYGVFDSIIEPLRQEIGFPYTVIPSELLIVGQGGTADTASLCGALNGAASAVFLITGGMDKSLREKSYNIIQDIFLWYEKTALPDHKPKNPKFNIVKSVSESTLCHVSVSKWCKASKFKSFSPERSERCGWLTASVAKQAVKTLNKNFDNSFKRMNLLSEANQTCRECHDKGSSLENSRAITNCGGCHFTSAMKEKHPGF